MSIRYRDQIIGGSEKFIQVTKAQYDILVANERLVPGAIYNIIDDVTEDIGQGNGIVDDKFLPDGTVITVGASGADFTSLQEALDYLEGKISNGNVTIHINAGTYTENSIIYLKDCNISQLTIEGEGITESIIQTNVPTINGIPALYINVPYLVILKDFCLKDIQNGDSNRGLACYYNQRLMIKNTFKVQGYPNIGIMSYAGSIISTENSTAIDISNCGRAMVAGQATISLGHETTLNVSNCTTAICTSSGGIFQYNNLIRNYTSVTNYTSQTVNTAKDTGLIMGTIQS